MKKFLTLLLTLFVLSSCEQDPEIVGIDAAVDKKPVKITICHYNKGNDTWKTIEVNEKQLQRHLDHGDFEGSCEDTKTYVPDNTFEGYLLCKGYDDVMDDYVLTSNIARIEELTLPFDSGSDCGSFIEVADLTGIQDFVSLKYLSTGAGIEKVIDLSTLTKLEELRILGGYQLETLNITKCVNLKKIYLGTQTSANRLSNLDLTNNINLQYIDMNHLTELTDADFSHCTNLEFVRIENETEIKNVNLSNSPLLEKVFLSIEHAESVNLKNGNNINITDIELNLNNQSSICVQVDDALYSETNWTNRSETVVFSEDCGY